MMTLALGLASGQPSGLCQPSGASSQTKIVNALRLKDLTIMKLILTAIGVGPWWCICWTYSASPT